MEYELYHHGILGMKWGIRRFQNKDGSYTEAGRRRRNKNNETSLVAPGSKWDKRYQRAETVKAAFEPGPKGKPSRAERIANEVKSVPEGTRSVAKGVYDLKRGSRDFDLSKMSDEDLKKAINRMDLERKYVSLKSQDITRGESRINSILDIAGGVTGIASSAVIIAATIWQIAKHRPLL